ncbi:hypothetical protein SALBM217S_04269 [Streptomyces griseoloalbus]
MLLGLQDRTTRDRAAAWMEGDEAAPALRLWRALARRCVGPYGEYAAAPLTLAGWVAWSSGDELEAREALAMALGADPDYLFARLLHQACNEGLDPESIRRCLRGGGEGESSPAEVSGVSGEQGSEALGRGGGENPGKDEGEAPGLEASPTSRRRRLRAAGRAGRLPRRGGTPTGRLPRPRMAPGGTRPQGPAHPGAATRRGQHQEGAHIAPRGEETEE